MNNLNYDGIFDILNRINFPLAIVIIIIGLVILFLISKILLKAGIFLLAMTFIFDMILRVLPFDIYLNYPNIKLIIYILYALGFVIFAYKNIKRILKEKRKRELFKDKNPIKKEKSGNNPIKRFFSYTGSLPFLLMLVLNLFNPDEGVYKNILHLLTSLSFLFMVFTTLYNTYKRIDTLKENKGRMRFDDLNIPFKKNSPQKSKNSDRKVLKKEEKVEEDFDKTQTRKLNLDDIKEELNKNSFDPINLDDFRDTMDQTDLINLINDKNSKLVTMISLTNLSDGVKKSYKSDKCIADIRQDSEYKVDLEFENYNDYDYGRFIDLLLDYSKNRSKYKFQLDLVPQKSKNSRVVFYDPSNLYELDRDFGDKFQGRTISMNFPKYKINYITQN
ncbi:hypothetical protein [Anaerococcus rubeinfantis]|uniref:hypothetical protein n=1 Tax=Anaerococcus rubeinfantis TaxID=1720199 RepID=UPI00073E97CA|nr:hypothetical protein [Anaerococcus rubeinfantis]